MQVSRLVRPVRVMSLFSVIATISRSSASALRTARPNAAFSLLAAAKAVWMKHSRYLLAPELEWYT